jgi:ADP-dependent NAD(P)H-hydrate dehydratase / NAD(P)H-hydrate epimerase
MKILTSQQIKAADQYTITHEPIASIELMERAANACVEWITEKFNTDFNFNIICGLGNNGGDGLAIARLLADKNYIVDVYAVGHSENRSPDFLINYARLISLSKNNLQVKEIKSVEEFQGSFKIDTQSIIIDALFGTGLNKPIQGLAADITKVLNALSSIIIAIDVPSGLFCDELNEPTDLIVRANFTLTFQFPKLSFMLPETAQYVGDFSVLDIYLNADFIANTNTSNYFITKEDVQSFLKKRTKIAHKGNFGRILIIAGSYGKMGAAVLASKACMHAGAGLLTAHIPKTGYEILQISLPEAMVEVDSDEHFISELSTLDKYDAIGVGPGIGTEQQTQNVLKLLIQNTPVPLVIDADAINILSENKTWLAFIPANSILTPHPKEFERLTGKAKNSFERLQKQREFSIKNNVYVVLKGAHTSVSCPDGIVFFNSTGNPGMATAGSGDVLTGIITALIAQGYNSKQACILGVYLHGLAGDFSAIEKSEESMTSVDIITHLAQGFQYLHNNNK